MLWNEYEPRIKAIPKVQFNQKDFVESSIKDFIGTQEQINEERERLMLIAKETDLTIHNKYHEEYNSIVKEYINELFYGYTEPREVLDKAYAIAYDRGHSSGYAEVECIFLDILDTFIEVYNLGVKDGASGKQ